MIDSSPRTADASSPDAGGARAVQALIEQARRHQRVRRRRVMQAAALVLLAAAVCVVASGLPGRDRSVSEGSPLRPAAAMPAQVVVWTSNFRIEVVSSRTGRVIRTLATDVAEIQGLPSLAVSHGVVYFDTGHGSQERVMRVALGGGRPSVVAVGCQPAVSPDGQLLAFVANCGSADAIEVRNLATGAQRRWLMRSDGLGIDGLSWSPDNRFLSFTAGGNPVLATTARILDTYAGGTLRHARKIPLAPGVDWAGYLTPRIGLVVIVRPGRSSPWVLAEVAVRSGAILRQLTMLPPPALATANAYDGTEGTIAIDPRSHSVLIAGAGPGSGVIFRWTSGMPKPVRLVRGSMRAVWAGQ